MLGLLYDIMSFFVFLIVKLFIVSFRIDMSDLYESDWKLRARTTVQLETSWWVVNNSSS